LISGSSAFAIVGFDCLIVSGGVRLHAWLNKGQQLKLDLQPLSFASAVKRLFIIPSLALPPFESEGHLNQSLTLTLEKILAYFRLLVSGFYG